MIGKKIANYTITRKIGEGGMAEVYYAENRLRKSASVKILKKSLCEVEGITERFRNEAEVMVKLNHPNIRQVYDYTELDGRPAIIMEYLEGESLKDYVRNHGRLNEKNAATYWNDLASALNYTHKQGVVHRDIKPSNIFVTSAGEVKLLDFGIAKIKDKLTGTQTGQKMGTLIYMSPEQVNDTKHVDYRTDVYSLAVTFVQALTGKAPYDPDTSSEYAIMDCIVRKPLDMSGVPAAWQTFLRPYLAKERDHRPALVRFSEPANASIPMQDKPIQETFSAGDKTVLDETKKPKTDIPTSQIEESIQQPIRSRKGLWLVLSGVALLVVALVIVLSVMKHKKSHPEEIVLEYTELETAEAEIIEDAVTDYDGNSYDAVQIGDQVWMAENLRTKHYSDGAYISSGNGTSETTAYWYYPDGNSGNASRYGLLYNWPAVMHGSSSSSSNPSGVQGICPNGWHVPSDAEWTQLTSYVGSQPKYRCKPKYRCNDDMENIAKALASTSGWESDTDPCTVGNGQSSNNATGFNAVPAGYYYGIYYNFGLVADFWSATQNNSYGTYIRDLECNNAGVYRSLYGHKDFGFSVRCLRD